MLSKCANPGCPASFLYLHEGKLFRLDSDAKILVCIPVSEVTRPSHRFEFFWLCDACAVELTLQYSRGTGNKVVPLVKQLARVQTV